MKSVQVLLSSYNGEKYIEQQLDSIFKQDGVDIYCLVRDDGSKDNTIKLLQEYQVKNEKIEIVLGENIGYKKSFLKLVELSGDHEYYSFADQDDVWKPEKLIKAINKISEIENDSAVMYCSNCILVDEQLNEINMLHSKKNNIVPTNKTKAIVQGFAHGCTMVFNKESKKMVVKYSPNYDYAHDYWIPLLHIFMGRLIYDKESYISYRQHSNNVFGAKDSLFGIIKYQIKSFKKNSGSFSNLADELMKGYKPELSSEDLALLSDFKDYKEIFSKKIKLILNRDLKKNTLKGTLYIKFLILCSKF